eukprot:scaffold15151_cov63-Phaeocystis_antarctica.AAC.6
MPFAIRCSADAAVVWKASAFRQGVAGGMHLRHTRGWLHGRTKLGCQGRPLRLLLGGLVPEYHARVADGHS